MYSEIIWPLQALLKMLNHLSYHLGYWLQLQTILMTFITGIKFPLNYSLIWLGQKMVLFWLLKELLHQKWNWREQNYKVFWKNKLNFLFRLITLYLVWSGKQIQIILFYFACSHVVQVLDLFMNKKVFAPRISMIWTLWTYTRFSNFILNSQKFQILYDFFHSELSFNTYVDESHSFLEMVKVSIWVKLDIL